MVVGMPLGRYFVFVGSLLLALLILADRYMPKPINEPARADVDRSIIRLHSSHKWPERIVIDTSLPTIVPPPTTNTAEISPARARPPKDAFALATPEAAPIVQKAVRQKRTGENHPNGRRAYRQLRCNRIPHGISGGLVTPTSSGNNRQPITE